MRLKMKLKSSLAENISTLFTEMRGNIIPVDYFSSRKAVS